MGSLLRMVWLLDLGLSQMRAPLQGRRLQLVSSHSITSAAGDPLSECLLDLASGSCT